MKRNTRPDQMASERFAFLYQSGKTCQQVADETGWSKSCVNKTLARIGLAMRPWVTKKHYTLSEDWFQCVDTAEKAYWLGFLAADGVNGGTYFRLALKESDREHVQKFATAVGSNAPIKQIRHSVKGKVYLSAAFSFWSVKMIGDLVALGITQRKSFTVRPWNGPSELMVHYWRGVFDGDGCLSSTRTTIAAMLVGNRNMMRAFAAFVKQRTGITLKVARHKSIFSARAHKLSSVQRLTSLLYGESAEFKPPLDRKADKAQILQQRRLFPNHARTGRTTNRRNSAE